PIEPTRVVLKHFGLDGFMKTVIGGNSLPQMKPDPAPLRLALQDLGVTGDHPRALYVGDSEVDAACAAAVPVPFLIFSGGYRKTPIAELTHQHAFDHFDELFGLVSSSVPA
ncbi:MAG: HAD hydrolase-like protein, partial [Paracoccus sp. (in: a-proteobacteria)]|nr:HAD hydrolase-like protein [Paracoccus sp. (in: a-proteobacteria)]